MFDGADHWPAKWQPGGEARKQHARWARAPLLPTTNLPRGPDDDENRCRDSHRTQPRVSSLALRERREVDGDGAGALVPLHRLAGDGPIDDARQPRGEVRSRRQDVNPLATLVRQLQTPPIAGLHRIRSGHEMVQEHTEAVDVAPDRGLLSVQ